MTITAKMIADSVGPSGVRLCTMQLKYPRFIHAEFMTHRMFSRNASSSRAIPIEKMLEDIADDTAMPIHWGSNQAGMQAGEEINPASGKWLWNFARNKAIDAADAMGVGGYHKQVANRLTEPFQHINVIVTATEWDNFFKLRLHPDAQPEIQELARVMKEAMKTSDPATEGMGGDWDGLWHLPYVTERDVEEYFDMRISFTALIKASVARCARVSYLNHDQTKPDIKKDITLYDRLLASGHMSPFEHIATPITPIDGNWRDVPGITHEDRMGVLWSANLQEWVQWRNLL